MIKSSQEPLLDRLAAQVRQVEHKSDFVLVTGERGVGKTFLGQELYRRLAATQSSPFFWPIDLLSSSGEAFEGDRHITRPERIAIPQGATPTFAWIGVSCERSADQIAFNALGAAASQVERLQTAIDATMHAGRAGRSPAMLLDLLEILTAFGSLAGDPTATALSMALTARTAASVYRELSADRADREDLRVDSGDEWQVDAARPDPAIVSRYCSLLAAFADRVRLPTVLFLDDLQNADPTTLALLEALPTAVPNNLTVLCTAERSALDRSDGTCREGVGMWLRSDPLPRITRIELDPPDDSVLRAIVLARAPDTPRETVAALIHRSGGNPYRLGLLLDSPRALPHGARITLDPHEINAFPDRIESLYRQAWSYLPASVRQIVALASTLGRTVPREILQQACAEIGIVDFDSGISTANDQQWLIGTQEVLAFSDQARYAVAASEAEMADTLAPSERVSAGTHALELATAVLNGPLAEWVGRGDTLTEDVPRRVVPYLETVVTLGSACQSKSPEDTARLTTVFADFLLARGEPSLAATHLSGVGRKLRGQGKDEERARMGLRLELRAAEIWSDSGAAVRAGEAIDEIERDCPASLLQERRTRRRMTFIKGRSLIRLGRQDLGIPMLRQIAREPSDGDGLIQRSSSIIVDSTLYVGNLQVGIREFTRRIASDGGEAIWWRNSEHCRELRQAIADHGLQRVNAARVATRRAKGYEDRYFDNKADVLTALGMWRAAIEVYDDIVAGLEATDPYDHSTIVAIGSRGMLLSKTGQGQRGLEEIDREMALYDAHARDSRRDMLVARGNRAQALSRLGRCEEALEEVDVVYEELTRLLGRDHPDALQNRMGRARILARAGDVEAATAAFHESRCSYERVFGNDHPDTRQYSRIQAELDNDPPLLSIEEFGSDALPPEMVARDEARASAYRLTQSEDWDLLYGTASFRLRVKRTTYARLLDLGLRFIASEERQRRS